MTNSIIKEKSFKFAIDIIHLNKRLNCTKSEFVLSNQILRSGTSIGANVREALNGQSTKDFLSKMSIALKEADETRYWLELLISTNYLEYTETKILLENCDELCKILSSIVKTTKTKL